jgi:hypothetical protein
MQKLVGTLLAYSHVGSRPRPFAQAPSATQRARVTYGELPVVMGDRSQLVQLMQNLNWQPDQATNCRSSTFGRTTGSRHLRNRGK